MANVRIGPDGTILKDDQVVSSDNRTVIGDDGTIVSTSVGGSSAPVHRGGYNAPPVSPLEGRSRSTDSNSSMVQNSTPQSTNSQPINRQVASMQAVKEKEYDIQMIEGRIRNSIPTKWIIATIALCVVAFMGLYFLFIPAVVTGILVIVGFTKKSELEAERDHMISDLNNMKGSGS